MYKSIIWDFDGTLFDTYPGIVKTFLYILKKEYSVDMGYDILYSWAKRSLTYCKDKIAMEFNINRQEFEKEFNTQYWEKGSRVEQAPFPGAQEICTLIKSAGKRNFIITHSQSNYVMNLVKKYKMYNLFEDYIGIDHPFPRKPKPDSFKFLIEKYNLNYKEVVAIGDRDLDILAGKNAGVNTCFFSPVGEVSEIADYNISKLLEVKGLLDL